MIGLLLMFRVQEGAAGLAHLHGQELHESADQTVDRLLLGSGLRRLKKRSSRSPKIFFPITVRVYLRELYLSVSDPDQEFL